MVVDLPNLIDRVQLHSAAKTQRLKRNLKYYRGEMEGRRAKFDDLFSQGKEDDDLPVKQTGNRETLLASEGATAFDKEGEKGIVHR